MFKKQQGEQYVELKSKSGQLRRFCKVKYLGSGGFARCYEVCEQIDGVKKHYATKIIKKATLYQTKQLIERLRTEIRLHKRFSEPDEKEDTHIVRFIESFETQDYIYLLMELCVNQTLNQLIRRRKILTQEETRFFIRQLAQGLKELHSKNVVHRDIKLCNLFLSHGLVLKIGDFGLATQIKQNKKRYTLCGTANYIAPEMIQKDSNGTTIGHGYQVDIWSLGVVCYTIYYGRYPFQAQEQQSIYNKIIACKYSFNPYTMREMKDLNINGLGHFPSSELQSFIKSIFQIDPAKRLTLDEVLSHPFLNKTSVPKLLPQISLKCSLKKQTIESLFLQKKLNQQQNISVSQHRKQDHQISHNFTPLLSTVKSFQKKSKQTTTNGAQFKEEIFTKTSQNINEGKIAQCAQESQNFIKNDQHNQGNNSHLIHQKLKHKDGKIFFNFQRKPMKSLGKRLEKGANIFNKESKSQSFIPVQQQKEKVLLQVILNNKPKDINCKKTKISQNGIIIKVYRMKNVDEENQGVNNLEMLSKQFNEYSLILHPQLKYLTKVINNHSTNKNSRQPLGKIDQSQENISMHQPNVQKQSQEQNLHSKASNSILQKKVLKIPFIPFGIPSKQCENSLVKKYEEQFYIVKMVYKSLQNLCNEDLINQ